MESVNATKRCSPEVRERAIRLVFEHEAEHDSQWAAIESIAMDTAETLRKRELKRASGILRKASASFAQAESDRRPK